MNLKNFLSLNILSQVIKLVLNHKRKGVLETEMEKISVPFKFFEVQSEEGTSQTKWTRLDGIEMTML